MSQLKKLGSTAFARVRAAVRIEGLRSAQSPDDLVFRVGQSVGFLDSASELNLLGTDDWSELLEKTEQAYDNHPLAIMKFRDLAELHRSQLS